MTVRPITHSMTDTAFAIEVIGIQYYATEMMQGVTEVLCHGTAVVADRVQL